MRKGFSVISGIFSIALTLAVFTVGAVAIADTIGWRFNARDLAAATSNGNDLRVGLLTSLRGNDTK